MFKWNNFNGKCIGKWNVFEEILRAFLFGIYFKFEEKVIRKMFKNKGKFEREECGKMMIKLR